MDALDDLALLELGLGHAADAVGGEVGVARLDAAQAAEVLVALGSNSIDNFGLSFSLENHLNFSL